MIVWFNSELHDKFTLNVFNLRDITEGKYDKIEIKYVFMGEDERISVKNAWEKKHGEFLLACQFYSFS